MPKTLHEMFVKFLLIVVLIAIFDGNKSVVHGCLNPVSLLTDIMFIGDMSSSSGIGSNANIQGSATSYWSPNPVWDDTYSYVEMDFGRVVEISGIQVGGGGAGSYASQIILYFSTPYDVANGIDGVEFDYTFYPLLNNQSDWSSGYKIITGAPSNSLTPGAVTQIKPRIRTRQLRVNPYTIVTTYTNLRMRFDVFGCDVHHPFQVVTMGVPNVVVCPLGFDTLAFSNPYGHCDQLIMKPIDCEDIVERNPNAASGTYTIYPPTSTSPVTAYCDMDLLGGGWTVIQKRVDNTQSFYQNWAAYKAGFGNPNLNYWLGNENIFIMTSNSFNDYVGLIYMESLADDVGLAYYDYFSIYDESEDYGLDVGSFIDGNAGDCLSDHNGFSFTTKDVDNDGSSANCADINWGGWWYDSCHTCNPNGMYGNSTINAGMVWGPWKGFTENLKTMKIMIRRTPLPGLTNKWRPKYAYPTDCQDIFDSDPHLPSGVYTIYPIGQSSIQAYCELGSLGQGWTVIQRNYGDGTNMTQTWTTYENGFGSLTGSHYLGNRNIFNLANSAITGVTYKLAIALTDVNDAPKSVVYDTFRLTQTIDYTLSITDYNTQPEANALTDMMASCNNKPFQTFDKAYSSICATTRPGGWWFMTYFMSGNRCTGANLNGKIGYTDYDSNILWDTVSYKSSVMMIRPTSKKPVDCQQILDDGNSSGNKVYYIFPFEIAARQVYCSMTNSYDGKSGWTMIQRRKTMGQTFTLLWADYKVGFGTGASDYWIGNENLYQLTKNTAYQLAVVVVTAGAVTKYAVYDDFKIGPESDYYRLYVGSFKPSSTATDQFSAINLATFSTSDYGPSKSLFSATPAPTGGWWFSGSAISLANLNNLATPTNIANAINWSPLIPLGTSLKETYMLIRRKDPTLVPNLPYTSATTLISTPIVVAYKCNHPLQLQSGHTVRMVTDAVILPSKVSGTDPVCITPTPPYDCSDVQQAAPAASKFASGMNYLNGSGMNFQAYCDMKTMGGGWVQIMSRKDTTVSFDQTAAAYENGFGTAPANFWVGNSIIRALTGTATYDLLIELKTTTTYGFAYYSDFWLSSPLVSQLHLSGYQNSVYAIAGDSLSELSGKYFKVVPTYGGWWWPATQSNSPSNLNGIYYFLTTTTPQTTTPGQTTTTAIPTTSPPTRPPNANPNIFWYTYSNSMSTDFIGVSMKIRRSNTALSGLYVEAIGYRCTNSVTMSVTVSYGNKQACMDACTNFPGCTLALFDTNNQVDCSLITTWCTVGQGSFTYTHNSFYRMDAFNMFSACGPPPIMPNTQMSITSGLPTAMKVDYSCISSPVGYRNYLSFANAESMTCSQIYGKNRWVGSWMECHIPCNSVPNLTSSNVTIAGFGDAGTLSNRNFTVIYQCLPGYTLVSGDLNLICPSPYTSYATQYPVCQDFRCREPNAVLNATANYTASVNATYFALNTILTYNCTDPTYVFTGTQTNTASINCSVNNQWSAILGPCIPSAMNCSAIGNCSHGGVCIQNNVCLCSGGWTGINCNTPTCTPACVHGTCVNISVCNCTAGWNGTTCATPICTGGCLNGGSCTGAETCTCAVGWSGTNCQNAVCNNPCQNGGNCTAPNVCTCAYGWTGGPCTTFDCSPIGFCAHGGSCTGPASCTCTAGWTNQNCSEAICSPPCQNGGICSSPNTCTCVAGWTGALCTTSPCSPVCQNGGTCLFNQTSQYCQCPAGWTGPQCSTPVCTLPCVNGGSCVAPDTCSCAAGWTNSTCGSAICSSPCQNGGSCTSPNNCTCVGGWIGAACNNTPCSPACKNNGTCVFNQTTHYCQCPAGWSDAQCATPYCNPSCTNGGTCFAPNTCNCLAGWANSTCSSAVCSQGCLHGTCVSPGVCSCNAGWTGNNCSTAICTNPCQNGGSCVAPGVCACVLGYTGSTCSTPVCSPACVNGACLSPNNCTCVAGWTGLSCSSAMCIPSCYHGGSCVAPNMCNCVSSWTGSSCATAVCNPSCVNGNCTSPNSCSCSTGWSGSTCSVAICNPSCVHGTCIQPNQCSCNAGWTGPTCAIAICNPTCVNGGSCATPNNCSCPRGWTGSTCSIADCSDIGGCLHGATCISANKCNCPTGWLGNQCETPDCSPIGNCKNAGYCWLPSLCSCPASWMGANCSEPTPLSDVTLNSVASASDNKLIGNAEGLSRICEIVSAEITQNINQIVAIHAAVDFMSNLTVFLQRYINLVDHVPPTSVVAIAQRYCAIADGVMAIATAPSEAVKSAIADDVAVDRCAIAKSLGESYDNSKLTILNYDELKQIYGSFQSMTTTVATIIKAILLSGQDFTYNGKFFNILIRHMPLYQLSGLHLEVDFATATFQNPNDVTQLFDISGTWPNLSRGSPVVIILAAYITNVIDIDIPFNMPTISVKVFSGSLPLVLNPKRPIDIVGRPIPQTAKLFNFEKVLAQCEVSTIHCDLTTNADALGSLAKYPIYEDRGHFVIILPAIEFRYAAFISINSTPTATSYVWKLVVNTQTVEEVVGGSGYASIKYNYVKNTGLRVIIQDSVFLTFLGKSKYRNIMLHVLTKRDYSKYKSTDDLPDSACRVQSCFGYHIRLGFAWSLDDYNRRKRAVDSSLSNDTDFALEPTSNESAVVFKSSYFGSFGADLVIPPNTIEFSEIIMNFADLVADNAFVLAFMIACIVVFLIGVVISRYYDKSDLREWAYLPLSSNVPQHNFRYLISVSYNSVKRFNLGPRIWIRLIGSFHDTTWRLLQDGQRKKLFNGSHPANLMLTTTAPIGDIDMIHLKVASRSNSADGKLFELHVDKVIVVDILNLKKYIFPVKHTMQGNKEVAKFRLATEDDIKGFRYLVNRHSRVGISESHPWLSIFQRPLPSSWTRCERLGCVVSALFLAMLVNAMFYGKEAASPRVGVKVGSFFRISWFTVWTSFIGAVIVIPPTAVIGFIFKRATRKSAEESEYATIFRIKSKFGHDTHGELPLSDGEKPAKKKEPFKLRYEFIVLAWYLVGCCVLAASIFIVLYSLSWGREKSLQWLSGMLLHIIQDIIIIQTIKVMLFSLFSSTMLSLPDDGVSIGRVVFSKQNSQRRILMFKRLRSAIGGIAHHIVYVIAFAMVIGTTQNPYSNMQIKHLKPLVLLKNTVPVTDTVQDYRVIFNWLQTRLLPNFLTRNQLAFGGIFTRENIYFVPNHDVHLIGPIRLRQQRAANSTCPVRASIVPTFMKTVASNLYENSTITANCLDDFTEIYGAGVNSEQRTFNGSWGAKAWPTNFENSTVPDDMAPWTYRQGDGPPYAGIMATYVPGGYYIDLPLKLSSAIAHVKQLRQKRWLDNATTVLFVDMVLFNAQTNIFAAVKIVFEGSSAGGFSYHVRMYPLQLYLYSGANSFLVFIIQAIWILVLFTHGFRLARTIKKKGCNNFRKDGWNLLDFFQLLISFAIVGLFAFRLSILMNVVTQMQSNHSSFINLDLLANWEELMANLYGITFFMTMLLFFRHLSFNKYWAIFLGTLSKGKHDLMTFVVVFTIITVMFAGLGYASLGMTRYEFRSYTGSIMTLIQNIIGPSGTLMSLSLSSRYILVFCLAYSTLVMFLAVQIFMAIIAVTYGLVSSNVERNTDWDKELANYLSSELQEFMSPKTLVVPDDSPKPYRAIGEKNFGKLESAMHKLNRFVSKDSIKEWKQENCFMFRMVEQEKELSLKKQIQCQLSKMKEMKQMAQDFVLSKPTAKRQPEMTKLTQKHQEENVHQRAVVPPPTGAAARAVEVIAPKELAKPVKQLSAKKLTENRPESENEKQSTPQTETPNSKIQGLIEASSVQASPVSNQTPAPTPNSTIQAPKEVSTKQPPPASSKPLTETNNSIKQKEASTVQTPPASIKAPVKKKPTAKKPRGINAWDFIDEEEDDNVIDDNSVSAPPEPPEPSLTNEKRTFASKMPPNVTSKRAKNDVEVDEWLSDRKSSAKWTPSSDDTTRPPAMLPLRNTKSDSQVDTSDVRSSYSRRQSVALDPVTMYKM